MIHSFVWVIIGCKELNSIVTRFHLKSIGLQMSLLSCVGVIFVIFSVLLVFFFLAVSLSNLWNVMVDSTVSQKYVISQIHPFKHEFTPRHFSCLIFTNVYSKISGLVQSTITCTFCTVSILKPSAVRFWKLSTGTLHPNLLYCMCQVYYSNNKLRYIQ